MKLFPFLCLLWLGADSAGSVGRHRCGGGSVLTEDWLVHIGQDRCSQAVRPVWTEPPGIRFSYLSEGGIGPGSCPSTSFTS